MLGLTSSILGGAPQQAAFTPLDIGNGGDTNQSVGPEIWLQVYNDIHSDENSNGSVSHVHNSIANNLDDQDRINAWYDTRISSDNSITGFTGIHAVQTTGGDKPKWDTATADIGAVHYPSGKFMDLTANITFDANTDFTIVMRFKPSSTATRTLLGHGANEFFRIQSSTVIRIRENGDGGSSHNTDFTSTEALATDKYITLMIVRSNGATGNVSVFARSEDAGYFDDIGTESQWGSTDQLPEEIIISNLGAAADDTANFGGHIKDLIIYNGTAVTKSQRKQLFDYIFAQDY